MMVVAIFPRRHSIMQGRKVENQRVREWADIGTGVPVAARAD